MHRKLPLLRSILSAEGESRGETTAHCSPPTGARRSHKGFPMWVAYHGNLFTKGAFFDFPPFAPSSSTPCVSCSPFIPNNFAWDLFLESVNSMRFSWYSNCSSISLCLRSYSTTCAFLRVICYIFAHLKNLKAGCLVRPFIFPTSPKAVFFRIDVQYLCIG